MIVDWTKVARFFEIQRRGIIACSVVMMAVKYVLNVLMFMNGFRMRHYMTGVLPWQNQAIITIPRVRFRSHRSQISPILFWHPKFPQKLESHLQIRFNPLSLSWENKTNIEICQHITHRSEQKSLRENLQNDFPNRHWEWTIDYCISSISANILSLTSKSSRNNKICWLIHLFGHVALLCPGWPQTLHE